MLRSCTAATLVVLDAAARKFKALGPSPETSPCAVAVNETAMEERDDSNPYKALFMERNEETEHDRNGEEGGQEGGEVDEDEAHHTTHTQGMSKRHILQGSKCKYRILNVIGRGAYAKVYNCTRQDGKMFALKVFDPINDLEDDEETTKYTRLTILREIEFLKKLRRPSIITFEEQIGVGEESSLIIEKMEMSLLDLKVYDCLIRTLCEKSNILFDFLHRV